MDRRRRHWLATLAAGGMTAAAPRWAHAAGYPDRPVRLVVPYPAGGVVDLVARVVADGVGAAWGQQVLVENRAGANGNIGAMAVKGAPADGYTLLVGSLFMAVNPLIDRNARYSLQDFEAIVQIGAAPNVLVVPASSPARTLADFIALARQHPGKFNTPNPGVGSSNHLGLEILQQATGIELLQVNYKGQPQFITDLANGELHFAYLTAALALPHVAAGRLRALAVASGTRLKALPAVPTLAESGWPGTVVQSWSGVFAPAGAPRPLLDQIGADVQKALRTPAADVRHEALHAEIAPAPLDFPRFVQDEQQRWKQLVAQRRITADGSTS